MDAPDPIVRLNGALEGRYRIERELGEGGMASVYLADDLKHERSVALKVLKPELAAVVGAERFLAEIKTTANLQHPHVLPLYDSGEADGLLFYVMPYVEGESLRDRLDRERQLPVDDAVRIATSMAEALDYAHRQGVIHRDIKPANVMLQDGTPVISDFGIALAVGAAGGGRLTETGLSLGTPHYMSPEQATGDQAVGPSTDIYALGCVLYEMLVGEPPFTGSTPRAVLGRIITGEVPSARAERASVPAHVDAVITKALDKVPADRFRTASDMAIRLGDADFRHRPGNVGAGASRAFDWRALSVGLVGMVALLGGGLVWALTFARSPSPAAGVFPAPFIRGQEPTGAFSLSPDGNTLAYAGPAPEGLRGLWLREWGELESTPAPGVPERANAPSYAPDGGAMAFQVGTQVLISTLDGTPARPVLEGHTPVWGVDDVVYVSRAGAIWGAPAGGGAARLVKGRTPGDIRNYYMNAVLPGGTHAVIDVGAGGQDYELHVLDLVSGDLELLGLGSDATFVEPGYLVYRFDGDLVGAAFDPEDFTLGTAVPLVERVGSYSLAETGALFYVAFASDAGGLGTTYVPVWVDRDGNEREVEAGWQFQSGTNTWTSLRLSPDGSRLALTIGPDDANGLYVRELPDGPTEELTRPGVGVRRPRWFDDGRSILFNSQVGGYGIWTVRADGSAPPERFGVTAGDGRVYVGEFSPAEDWLVLYGQTADANADIFAVQIDPAGEPADSVAERVISTPGLENSPAISPDGRWLAYVSTQSRTREVYVRPFPDTRGARELVSVDGGTEPLWSPGGDELFYRRGDGVIVSARYEVTAEGFAVTERTALFDASSYLGNRTTTTFDVTPDGTSFIFLRIEAVAERESYHVLDQGFGQRLRDRVPR